MIANYSPVLDQKRSPVLDQNSHCSSRTRLLRVRKGSLLTEMVVCTVLLSAVTAVLVPTVAKMIEQRKLIRFDTLCLVELDNVAAEIRHRSAASQELSGIELTPSFARRYRDAVLVIDDSPETNGAPTGSVPPGATDIKGLRSLKITIRKSWRPHAPDIVHSLIVWLPEGIQSQKSEEVPNP